MVFDTEYSAQHRSGVAILCGRGVCYRFFLPVRWMRRICSTYTGVFLNCFDTFLCSIFLCLPKAFMRLVKYITVTD